MRWVVAVVPLSASLFNGRDPLQVAGDLVGAFLDREGMVQLAGFQLIQACEDDRSVAFSYQVGVQEGSDAFGQAHVQLRVR